MPQIRVPFSQIKGYQPSADFRKSGVVGVLTGRNFAWDAAGVKADFATRLIASDTSLGSDGLSAYEIPLPCCQNYHVAVGDKIWKFVPSAAGNPTGTWEHIATLDRVQKSVLADVPAHYRGFTSVLGGGKTYACSWNFGVYRINVPTNAYTRLTSATVSGFPPDSEPIIALSATHGRQLYLTKNALYWSNTNAPEDLTPALGGAGFQVLAELIGGEPRAIVRVSAGAIVFTTEGALVAEFIGGDGVFRFYELAIEVLPLSQSAVTTLPDGTHLLMARMGIYHASAAAPPEELTPLFNTFLREYLRNRPLEVAHLWYTQADNRLFVSLKTDDGIFYETFVLDLGLDKWGILNDLHLGMFHYTAPRGAFAYLNPQGIASYFLPGRSPFKDKENPFAPGTYTGLGSFVSLGFIRAEQMAMLADSVQELQEVVVLRSNPLEGIDNEVIDEGNVLAVGAALFDEGLVTDPDPSVTDEGFVLNTSPPYKYRLDVQSDLFTENQFATQAAHLAYQGRLSDTWTLNIPGYNFTLKFRADEPDEFFRVNAGDCTLTQAGQVI